jgi:hypothetical protein
MATLRPNKARPIRIININNELINRLNINSEVKTSI